MDIISKSAREHINKRTIKLFAHDKIRLGKIIEIIQYGILYSLISLFFGIKINHIFPVPDEEKNSFLLIIEIIAQSILAAIGVFYTRKLVKIVPLFYESSVKYTKYGTKEFDGEIIIAIIYITTQKKIIDKIDILIERLG
jgi:hypothetical protein